MDFQISPSNDEDSRKQKYIRRKFQKKAGLGLFARTMICIVIIDAFIWGYCTFVKKVTLLEGLQSMTVFFHEKIGSKSQPKQITSIRNANPEKRLTINNRLNASLKNTSQESYIYKWKDKNGSFHFSNTNFPANNKTLELIKDEKPYSRQTKFKIHGGTMLIPVEVENKGHKETINLILDTGCGITQIHPDVIQRLNPRKIRKGKSHIADGREIDTTIYEIDSIKVGSIEEMNFTVATPDKLEHKRGIDGLLGMNFLRRHPFEVDKKSGVIIWE
jgi:predicted aspartyl protease